MRSVITILLLIITCVATAQVKKAPKKAPLADITFGIKNDWDGDLSTTMAPSMLLFQKALDSITAVNKKMVDSIATLNRQLIAANYTVIYKGPGILGGTSPTDKLRLDMDNLFYRSTTPDIKTWRKVQGMLFWSNNEGAFLYWSGNTLMKIYATAVK